MTNQYSLNTDNLPLPLTDELEQYLVEQYQVAQITVPDCPDVTLYNWDSEFGFTLSFEPMPLNALRLSHLIYFSNVEDVVDVHHYLYSSEYAKWLCADTSDVATKCVRDSLVKLHKWHIDNELQVEIE